MLGTSDVPENLNLSLSKNLTTWVIPESEAYSFGKVKNTMGSRESNTTIYKGASVRGFRWCMHSVIDVDITHLKGRCASIMFVATAQDGIEQAYTLAVSYEDSENNTSYEWFLIA
ncbi:hypothetical protein Dsin_002177 [Dipteronia sinensis]|uniref:Uncharacterized protein n=1 Tax=Dipteronia sinensis TaxID=43782 RepID=A0AAE0B5Q9_9ROSI|nr:hypothetical protein Dsin_002177 [Dipteronia sinensis]